MHERCYRNIHDLIGLCLLFPFKDKLTDLKLVVEDTVDNVATLQDCNMLGQNTEKTYRLTLHDITCCFFYLVLVVSLRDPGAQDGSRPGHHTRAEEHVC